MNVLLVEEDREVGSRLRRRMEGAGHMLDWTAEAHQAFECAASSRYDAVIVALGSSEVGRLAIELCARLRNLSPALPILVLSAGDGVGDRLASFAAGADDVLAKPFDCDELMARLAAIQRRKAPPPKDTAARPTRMIVLERAGSAARRTSRVVGLTDCEQRFFAALFEHKSEGVSLTAALRKVCDAELATRKPGLRLSLAGARLARRRA